MNGWIEPQQQTETRAARIKLRDAEYRLTQAVGPEKAQEVLKGVPYDVPIQQVAEAVKLIADLAEAQAPERRLDAMRYDFTPFPKEMPDIDFETVDEIPF